MYRGIKYFDADSMRAAQTWAYKKNETAGADVAKEGYVPQEEAYKTQLFILLQACLPNLHVVIPELSAPHARNADLGVDNPEGDRVVIELVAHARDGPVDRAGSVLEHIARCEEQYFKIPRVKQVWLINFTTKRPEKGYVWNAPEGRVKVIHVWHDLDWTSALITEAPNSKPEQVALVYSPPQSHVGERSSENKTA